MYSGTILLHTCCAPCATASLEKLKEDGYLPTLFFSNSNIWPMEEYNKRLDNARLLAESTGWNLIEDTYNHDLWLKRISLVPGHTDEPEGGARCAECFRFSFDRAAKKTAAIGIGRFTTTLSISPFKNSDLLFTVGSEFAGFMPIDFKKGDGYKRSIGLSRELGLYRQQYCGCEFSRAADKSQTADQ